LLLGLLSVAALVRFINLTGESLWYDEAYSVWSSAMEIASLKTLWDWQIEFPLFYLLLHYWMRLFGQGEFAVRAMGAVVGTLTIWPMYALGKALWGRREGALAALLLAVNPYHTWYSQEVRMYAWAVLVTVASLYAFWRVAHGAGWGWWLAHALLTGLVFHLHYYIGWAVLAENVFMVVAAWRRCPRHGRGAALWRQLWPWVLNQALVLLLALPALAVFRTKLVGMNQWDWLAQRYGAPGLAEVLDLFVAYTVGTTFAGVSALRWVAVGVGLALAAWGAACGLLRSRGEMVRREAVLFAVLLLGLPVGLVFALGQVTTVWVPRYLLLFLPAYLLLVATGMATLSAPLRGVSLAILLALSLYALSGLYTTQHKEDWRGVTAYLSAQVRSEDLLVLMDDECRVPFDYYSRYDYGARRIEISRFADDAALENVVERVGSQRNGGRLWLVVSHADSAALEAKLATLPGLHSAANPGFVGIRVVAYEWQ
jgi:uncharacterized membrane protein